MKLILNILLIISFVCNAQNTNLVPNYSFEDTLSCTTGYDYADLKYWYNPTNNTPNALHICVDNAQLSDEVKKHSGYGRALFFIYYVPGLPIEGREYIATSLTKSLEANKKYCIDFYTMPVKGSKFGCNSIGVYFGIGSQFYNTLSIPSVSPQSNFILTTPITDTSTWYHYKDIYIATGDESDIIIGNFMTDSQIMTPIINTSSFVPANGAYFDIDDVSLHEMSLSIGNDTTVCLGTNLTIGEENLDTAFNGYYWYHNGTLIDSLISKKTMTFSQPDSFVIEKRFPCGSVFDTINVSVKTNCIVPETGFILSNVFSPNGDDINDVWKVDLGAKELESYVIYNRWGIEIYNSENTTYLTAFTSFIWDGRTMSGIECSDGVYYYTIQLKNTKGEIEKYRGYITLMR